MPSLPTDNLYKFVALSGILIVLSSAYYFLWSINNLNDKAIELEENIDIHSAGMVFWKYKRNRLEQGLIDADQRDFEHLDEKEISSLIIQNKEHGEELDKIMEIRMQMNISMAKINSNGKKLDKLKNELTETVGFIISNFLLGISMALWGFSKWYKMQKLIDDRIINGAEA